MADIRGAIAAAVEERDEEQLAIHKAQWARSATIFWKVGVDAAEAKKDEAKPKK